MVAGQHEYLCVGHYASWSCTSIVQSMDRLLTTFRHLPDGTLSQSRSEHKGGEGGRRRLDDDDIDENMGGGDHDEATRAAVAAVLRAETKTATITSNHDSGSGNDEHGGEEA